MDYTWLDTLTKAALEESPPQKLAPATTQTFSIVVLDLSFRPVWSRHVQGYHRVLGTSLDKASQALRRPIPLILKRHLSLADAMLAQFELICCDVISAFVSDAVISNADPGYLRNLWHSLSTGEEFEKQWAIIESVPENKAGSEFLNQFVGAENPSFPIEIIAMRKKARSMQLWARNIGAEVVVRDG